MPTPTASKRGRGKRTRGVTVGRPLRIRIDEYLGPPRRQYRGVAGKSVRLIVDNEKELNALFDGLARYLRGRSWRKH